MPGKSPTATLAPSSNHANSRTLTHFRRSVSLVSRSFGTIPMSSFVHLHCSLFWTHTAPTRIEQHYMISSPLSSCSHHGHWPGHQRGLPRTVLTHDAIASAAAQLEGCVAEQRLHLNRGRDSETLAATQTLVGQPRHTTTVHQDEVPEDGGDCGLNSSYENIEVTEI